MSWWCRHAKSCAACHSPACACCRSGRRTAETLLKNVGCEVITAIDGFDALARIVDHHPHIIFVDIMMPRLDGYQTCALVKNNPAFKSIPVIMLSSKDGVFDKARGRIAGADHYITKPFTNEQLLHAVQQFRNPSQGAQ
jgi:twitching motility two-component system response regulator PilG